MRRSGGAVRAGFLLGLVIGLTPLAAAEEGPAGRVVVLANQNDPDSVRIARHYAGARGVPEQNLLALPLPAAETISWHEFVATLWEPLRDQLVARRWIDATTSTLVDAAGRKKYAPFGHRLAALVVCRGVPLRIAHDSQRPVDDSPLARRAEYRTNAAAVDSELSLLAASNQAVAAFVANPLFQNDRPTALQRGEVIRVARLDGPTAADALGLVDRAIAAERTGLLGRAYVDVANRDPNGDRMFEAVAQLLRGAGFDTTVDRAPATFPSATRFDAPVLYFGWYAADLTGPFTLPGWRFPPGAVALHLHSFSAASLRSPTRGWAGPLVARGVTATVGNVYEPYLMLTHRPDLLVRALLRGETLAAAAYYALPALSWQAVLLGDPLYRPFAVSLEEQVKNVGQLPASTAGYAIERRMRQLETAGRGAEGIALARAQQARQPSLALGLALARVHAAAGNADDAAAALAGLERITQLEPGDWALARETALFLGTLGRAPLALRLWRTLLAEKELPVELRLAWLPEAVTAAASAKDVRQIETWRAELRLLESGASPR